MFSKRKWETQKGFGLAPVVGIEEKTISTKAQCNTPIKKQANSKTGSRFQMTKKR